MFNLCSNPDKRHQTPPDLELPTANLTQTPALATPGPRLIVVRMTSGRIASAETHGLEVLDVPVQLQLLLRRAALRARTIL